MPALPYLLLQAGGRSGMPLNGGALYIVGAASRARLPPPIAG